MTIRIDFVKAAPQAAAAMFGLERYLHGCGLEPSLLNVVKLRASQINGCAYCLDMHSKEARAAGETEQRIYVLDAWLEAPFYSARARRAGLDRGADAGLPGSSSRRRVRHSAQAIQRAGAGRPEPGGGRRQRLEPARDRSALGDSRHVLRRHVPAMTARGLGIAGKGTG